MAVDVTNMPRGDSRASGAVDARVMQRAVMLAGGALLFLAAVKLGFLSRVMP